MSAPDGVGVKVAVMDGGVELYRYGRDYWELNHSRWPGDVGGGRRAHWTKVTGARPFVSDEEAAACWQEQHHGRPIKFL